MIAIALALASAVSWGVADFLGGFKTRTVPLAAVALYSQATGLVLVLALLIAQGLPTPSVHVLAWGAATGGAYALGLAAFYRGLATGRMSVVAPLAGLSAALPVIVGLSSGDQLSALQAGGVVAAVLGIVLAARERDASPERREATRLAVGLGVLAAIGIGANLVGIEAATADRPVSALLWVLVATRSTAVVIWLAVSLRRGAMRALRRPPLRALAALGALDLLANILFGLAVRGSLLTLAGVLASLHPVFTLILSRIVLKERLQLVQQVGVVIAIAGVALLSA